MGVYCVTWKQRGTSFRAGPFFLSMNNTDWTQPVHPAQCRLHHLGRAGSPTAILLEEPNWCRCWKTIRLAQNSLLVRENKSSKHNGGKTLITRISRILEILLRHLQQLNELALTLQMRLASVCSYLLLSGKRIMSGSILPRPDRDRTAAWGPKHVSKNKSPYSTMSAKRPCKLGFQVNAALNWCIISNHCKVTGWPSFERDAEMSWGNPINKLANFHWAGIVWSEIIMSAKTEECDPESPSASALSRIKSVLFNSGWTQRR